MVPKAWNRGQGIRQVFGLGDQTQNKGCLSAGTLLAFTLSGILTVG